MAKYTKGNVSICFPLNKKYRSHIDIMALILEALRNNGIPRYSIMKQTGINYAQLKKYLESLSKTGFIEISMKAGKVVYRASQKGLAVLTQYNILQDMLLGAPFEANSDELPVKDYNRPDMPQNAMPLATRLPK
jgi:predicted transcriptional regulator